MDKKLGLGALISLVIGSMVGAGVFSLPQNIAAHASAGAVALGWAITGIGMICLALVYQNLSMRRPDLDGGIFSYAKAGFGDFVGFNAAWARHEVDWRWVKGHAGHELNERADALARKGLTDNLAASRAARG